MPNHVHMVMRLVGRNESSLRSRPVGRNDIPTYNGKPLFRILQSLKRHTATDCNRLLRRSGAFWQDESYDHVVRDEEELERTIWYVLNNPVNAGLAKEWKDWRWSYVQEGLIDT